MWSCLRAHTSLHWRVSSMIAYQHHTLEKNDWWCTTVDRHELNRKFSHVFVTLYKNARVYISISSNKMHIYTHTNTLFPTLRKKKKAWGTRAKKNKLHALWIIRTINRHCSNKFLFDNNQILVHLSIFIRDYHWKVKLLSKRHYWNQCERFDF